ncbi:aspartate carbamoyltransferase regulatory subunit [Ignisphaera sp. 4213-co]|uniref:Aspartate carbamoyltransferase regulatory chain n=1 Tax=Ignisphaera cupida TaxID=3050454 RepID=A0ABD4Z633_9CREN|nr:aspartate carbamoyltransferase regulatory subunit [Ignisphaera sp. 4213-co]MDK6028467.1 aspartate carbamoyltransferase regulatory subunit [Ignisphaera sp. 4213-co]
MSEEPTLVVSKIRNGTVIDHIPAGKAMDILNVLGINGREGLRIAILMNVESKKLGRKDIIKIEGKRLSPEDLNVIALLAPSATINIIEDFAVVEKHKVLLPNIIVGVLKCPNPTCITNKRGEFVKTRFRLISRDPVKLQCEYCGNVVSGDEVTKLIAKRR